jgi:hypothetical protein
MTQQDRPTFLTVLCILTWVGSGLVILNQLFTLATAGLTKEIAGLAEEGMSDAMDELATEAPEFGSFFSNLLGQGMHALEHLTELALVRIIGVLIVFAGSIMMWKLKKQGFWMFIAGKVIIIAGILFIMGGSGMGFMMITGPIIVGILFITLYGVNYKALN